MGPRRWIWFWGIAFAFAYAVWLVHDDSAKPPELAAGVLVAALAATGTELARRQRVAGIAIRARHLHRAWRLIPAAARDCGALTAAAIQQLLDPKPVRGRTVSIPFDYGGDEPQHSGRRALGEALGSFAPGTIVVGIDPENDVVIAHQLAASGRPEDLDPLELG